MGKIVSWYIIICVLGGFWQGSIWQESIVDVCQDLVTCYPVGDRKSSGQNRVRRQPTFLAYRIVREPQGVQVNINNNPMYIRLTPHAWKHIQEQHPKIEREDIFRALRTPTYVVDEYDRQCWLFYANINEDIKLRVVVGKYNDEVVTAYLRKRIGRRVNGVKIPSFWNRLPVIETVSEPQIIEPDTEKINLWRKLNNRWYIVCVKGGKVINAHYTLNEPIPNVMNEELLKEWR